MKRIFSVILLGGVVMLLAACSPRAKTVNVSLSEFQIEASQTTFKAGQPYHFVITNDGTINHEFMVMAPMMGDMEMTMEEMDAMAVAMVDAEELAPGTTQTIDITFTEDQVGTDLEFSCHVEDHYQSGMQVPITIE